MREFLHVPQSRLDLTSSAWRSDKFAADVALVNMTEWLVDAENLKIGDLVGAGAFAQVYRATLKDKEVRFR